LFHVESHTQQNSSQGLGVWSAVCESFPTQQEVTNSD